MRMWSRNYQRVGAFHDGDFRERLDVVSELGFATLKECFGVKGNLIISNIKFEANNNGLKLVELQEQEVLSKLKLMYEMVRGIDFNSALGDYKEIIVLILMLKDEYSEELAYEIVVRFYSYCVEKFEVFVPNVEWKNIIFICTDIDEQVEYFIDMMSCFHLSDEFINLKNSRIGMYQKFVLASTSDENLLLSLKNGDEVMEMCCEYKKGQTEYMIEVRYLYESNVMIFDVKYEGIFGKIKGGYKSRPSTVISSELHYNTFYKIFNIKDLKILWVLKNLNKIIEREYFNFY